MGKLNFEEMSTLYSAQVQQLETAGHTRKRQNLKLLKKTGGNLQLVQNFLDAKRKLKEAQVQHKRQDKHEQKAVRKLLKKEDIKDESSSSSSSSDSDDDHKKQKKQERKEKKQAKREKKELKKALKREGTEEKQLETAMQQCDIASHDVNNNNNSDLRKLSKEERRKLKEEKKHEKKEKKDKKKQEKAATKVPATLPTDITYVYIDGNNLLFVLQPIRGLCLHRKMASAESALQLIAFEWSKLTKLPVILIFDDTKKNETDGEFQVCSAKPLFPSSDDALANWAEKTSPDQAIKTLVFTSDRALSERIAKHGLQVMKSKHFFEIAAPLLGKKKEEPIDSWATRWLTEKGML